LKMNKTPAKLAFLCFLFCAGLSAGALDFGLALSQELKTSNESRGSGALVYTPVLSPWVSGPLGEHFSLRLSGKVGFEHTSSFSAGDDGLAWRDPPALPELERSELTWFVSPALSFTLGRQRFADPAGLAASGLFDGLAAAFSAGGSRFSAGAYYTGLLYKDTADIIMTNRDREGYAKPYALDESYFASRRVLASFVWEKPGLGPRSSLALGLLGQFDVNKGDDRLHSQYLSARYRLRLPANTGLEAAAVFGAGEAEEAGEGMLFFAGVLGGTWSPPGAWDDRLSLWGLYSSPAWGELLSAFIPVNSLSLGRVFTSFPGGLSLIKGTYTLRPRRTLGLTLEYSYFIRTDTVSFQDDRDPGKLKGEGYLLGGELYGVVSWIPLPDLAVSIGAGAFFPGLGNAFEPETDIRWEGALGIVLSL
jgi:hypothetical protein